MALSDRVSDLGDGLSLLLAELRASLPDVVRRFGRRQVRHVYVRQDRTGARAEHVSWLGDVEVVPVLHAEPDVWVLVPADSGLLTRTIDMSMSAFQRGQDAVRLRLDEISPLPVDDIAHAFGPAGRKDRGVRVDVVICRTTDLEDWCTQAADGARTAGAGQWHVEANGLVLARGEVKRPGALFPRWGLGLKAALLYLALILVLISWGERLSRRDAQLDNARIQARVMAQQLVRDRAALDAQSRIEGSQTGASLGDLVTRLEGLPTRLEEADVAGPAVVRQILLTPDGALNISGTDWPEPGAARAQDWHLPVLPEPAVGTDPTDAENHAGNETQGEGEPEEGAMP